MTAFHTEYNVIGVQASAPTDEQQAKGLPPLVTVNATVGMLLPIQTESGELPIIPIGQVEFHLTPADAKKIGEEAEKLQVTPKSDLLIANNMRAVEEAAEAMSKVTG